MQDPHRPHTTDVIDVIATEVPEDSPSGASTNRGFAGTASSDDNTAHGTTADPAQAPIARPSVRFMLAHPAHWIALGFGSGLSRVAPGTAGTLWAWLAFLVLSHGLNDVGWAWVIGLSMPVGWWACTVTARNMRVLDPGSVVWDEVAAFWLVLWLVMPAGLAAQFVAFALFRFFDAVKPGPVGWADALFHHVDPATDRHAWTKAGFGIMLDDLVAAACTLLVIAVWKFI